MKKNILMLIVGLLVGFGIMFGAYYFFFRNDNKVLECPKYDENKICPIGEGMVYMRKIKRLYNSGDGPVSFMQEVGDKIVVKNGKLIAINDTNFNNIDFLVGNVSCMDFTYEEQISDDCLSYALDAYEFNDFYAIKTFTSQNAIDGYTFFSKDGKELEGLEVASFYIKNNNIYGIINVSSGDTTVIYEPKIITYENGKIVLK